MTKEHIKRWLKTIYKFKREQFDDSVDVFKDLIDRLNDDSRGSS